MRNSRKEKENKGVAKERKEIGGHQVYQIGVDSDSSDTSDDDEREPMEVMEAYQGQRPKNNGKKERSPYCGLCKEKGHWASGCKYGLPSLLNDEKLAAMLRAKFPELVSKDKVPEGKLKNEKEERSDKKDFPQGKEKSKKT
jgi:hypothetical protein